MVIGRRLESSRSPSAGTISELIRDRYDACVLCLSCGETAVSHRADQSRTVVRPSAGSRRLAPLAARSPAHRRGLTLLPSARSGPGYAGRAAGASTMVGRNPLWLRRSAPQRHNDASGGGAQTPGWEGRRSRVPPGAWRASWGSHPDHLRPRQSRAVAAQGVKVVRTVARSTLTP